MFVSSRAGSCRPCLFWCSGVRQNNNGRISGTVTDATGSVIAGAKVTVTNASPTSPDCDHQFGRLLRVTDLAVSMFNVTVEAPGFKKRRRKATTFPTVLRSPLTSSSRSAPSPIALRSLSAWESVHTVSGELSSTVDSKQVQDLALNGRNYLQLVSLMPGVALLDEDQWPPHQPQRHHMGVQWRRPARRN